MHHRTVRVAARLSLIAGVSVLICFGVPGLRTTFGLHATARQQGGVNDPAELLAKAVKAVNAHRTADLKSLTESGREGAFAWVPDAHETWEASALPLAAVKANENAGAPDGGETLAVFHAWHSCQSDGDHVYRLIQTPNGWRFGAEIPETETLGLRVRDHDLHAAFDLPQKNATLSDTIQVERTAENAPAFALLRISQDFHIQSITLGASGSKTPVRFQQAGGVIAFAPPADRKFALTLRYSGHLDNQQSDYIRPNEAVLCSYWYPHIGRLPACTTVTATVPAGWQAIAQGELTKETHAPNGATTVTFRNETPNCFYTLDIGQYTIVKRVVKNRTLSIYQLRPSPARAQACLDKVAAAMDCFEHNFAPFPYTRYAVVETDGAFSGALEAYSFATFGPDTLPELIPHELAHTWWGGMIPCTYTRSMWDEAFAEYADDLFQRSQKAEAAHSTAAYPPASRVLSNRRKLASAFGVVPIEQAFDTEDDHQIAAGYDKGRQVLKMLETQLGQQTMLRSMRSFFAGHPKGEAADWPEFEAAVQKETGQNYRWFFGQWLARKGVPMVALAHTTVRKDGNGYTVETDVIQEGDPYRLRMPVLLETAGGGSTLMSYDVDGSSTHLTFKTTAAPSLLRLDPQGEMLFAPPLGSPAGVDPTLFTFPL